MKLINYKGKQNVNQKPINLSFRAKLNRLSKIQTKPLNFFGNQ